MLGLLIFSGDNGHRVWLRAPSFGASINEVD
jgi:hypothetical protein